MTDHPFRVIEWLDQEKPKKVILGDAAVDLVIDLIRRHDIENGDPANAFDMVQCQPVSHTAALVMSAYVESLETQVVHNSHLISRHYPFRIGQVRHLRAACRFTAVAVTPKISGDDREILSEASYNFVPHNMGLRIPME